MQSPRSAAAVSLPLLQRSGLSASHPDQSASVDANVGLVPTQSPPLIGINSPAGVLLARGDAVEAPYRRTAHPHVASRETALSQLPFRGPFCGHLLVVTILGGMNARTIVTRRMYGSIRARMCS